MLKDGGLYITWGYQGRLYQQEAHFNSDMKKWGRNLPRCLEEECLKQREQQIQWPWGGKKLESCQGGDVNREGRKGEKWGQKVAEDFRGCWTVELHDFIYILSGSFSPGVWQKGHKAMRWEMWCEMQTHFFFFCGEVKSILMWACRRFTRVKGSRV